MNVSGRKLQTKKTIEIAQSQIHYKENKEGNMRGAPNCSKCIMASRA
jgi:hypothetical protein